MKNERSDAPSKCVCGNDFSVVFGSNGPEKKTTLYAGQKIELTRREIGAEL